MTFHSWTSCLFSLPASLSLDSYSPVTWSVLSLCFPPRNPIDPMLCLCFAARLFTYICGRSLLRVISSIFVDLLPSRVSDLHLLDLCLDLPLWFCDVSCITIEKDIRRQVKVCIICIFAPFPVLSLQRVRQLDFIHHVKIRFPQGQT